MPLSPGFSDYVVELLAGLGLAQADLPKQNDSARWPELRERIAAAFKSKTRDEWAQVFATSDACVAPVLTFTEARDFPHNAARGTFVNTNGMVQPAPAPRFSRTPGAINGGAPERGERGREALADWGFNSQQVSALENLGLGCA